MKFYIYIHTHWDREWYFTNGVSQVLLKHNLNLYLQNPQLQNFYLDGQTSLVDDYLKITNKTNAQHFLKLLQNNKIITGPWFSQPDLFNSLGETTIRNLELAKEVARKNNFKLSPIMYAPDTFGFPQNFPQLLTNFNFKEMIFWRGLNHTIGQDHFIWQGINDFNINCYNLKYGYFFLGHLIDWTKLTENNLKKLAHKFVKDFAKSNEYKHFAEQKKEIILIGSGHDQAPPYVLIEKFFKIVNQISVDEFLIKQHQDYFKDANEKNLPLYNQALDYATNSKIHRTIASSRYTLKKVFRQVEHLLYHQLEPLQVALKSANNFYDNSQNVLWQKQLVKLQAHDALGGCISDEVYLETFVKLNDLKNQINAEKDYILKQLGNQKKLKSNEFLIFNPNVAVSENSFTQQTITLPIKSNLFLETKDYVVYIIYNCPNSLIKNGFEHDLIFINKKMKSFSLIKLNLAKMQTIKNIKTKNLENWNKFSLVIEDDLGDTYDFDPNFKKQPLILESQKVLSSQYNDLTLNEITYFDKENCQNFAIRIFDYQNKQLIKINTINKLQNSRVSLQINELENQEKIQYQQLLSLLNLQNDSQNNWKKYYKEKPVNNYRTSGLIVGTKNIIQTYGTNEFFIKDNKITIVLYRTVDKLGKGNLNYRPGPVSGLASKILYTPLAQYQNQSLEFNFQITQNFGLNINTIANNFLRLPMIYHHQSLDVESNKLGQFILDPNNYFDLNFKVAKLNKEIFVSSSWINFENDYQQTLVDLNTNEMKIIKNEK